MTERKELRLRIEATEGKDGAVYSRDVHVYDLEDGREISNILNLEFHANSNGCLCTMTLTGAALNYRGPATIETEAE